MKIRPLITCLLSFFSFLLSAQTFVNPMPISGYQVSSSDLLQFTVTHSKVKQIPVSFSIEVMRADVGPVLRIITGKHMLIPGSNSFSKANLNIIKKQYIEPHVGQYELKHRSLPPGDYTYCVKVICIGTADECEEILSLENLHQRCEDFNIINITPLLLNYPPDEAELEQGRPNFNWLPPMPLGNDPSMSYTYKLVQLRSNQTAEDGIRRNRAIYERQSIQGINQLFPTTLDELVAGESYAWQVEAFLGKMKVATSEVWEFEIKEDLTNVSFVDIQKPSNGIHVCEESLNFVYNSPGGESLLNYSIYDEGGNELHISEALYIEQGLNKLVLDKSLFSDIPASSYTIKVINPKRRQYSISFRFKE